MAVDDRALKEVEQFLENPTEHDIQYLLLVTSNPHKHFALGAVLTNSGWNMMTYSYQMSVPDAAITKLASKKYPAVACPLPSGSRSSQKDATPRSLPELWPLGITYSLWTCLPVPVAGMPHTEEVTNMWLDLHVS